MEPTQSEDKQTKKRPSSYVYEIIGNYSPHDAVPPEAIAGAWQVDEEGNIFGDFIPNPKYRGPREGVGKVRPPSSGKRNAPSPPEAAAPERTSIEGKTSARGSTFSTKVEPPVIQYEEKNAPVIWKVGDIILDTFAVTDIVGEGGMGTVYKVHALHWNIDLAVKSPKPTIFNKVGGKENFIREAETWMNLQAHPNIVQCRFVQTLSGIPRIFAEYVGGGSLADWIRQRKLYSNGPQEALARMLDVAIQFAWGLHAAHEQGLVHQDVKPANVMMTPDGTAKVADFGLAKARAVAGEEIAPGAGRSILVSFGGMTPAYCSPEQAARQPLNCKTDIWSWGVSVLHMFMGEVTWMSGVFAREALSRHQQEDAVIPAMPSPIVTLLSRCFEPHPENRPATMLEVVTHLQEIYARLLGCPYPREAPKLALIQIDTLKGQAISLHELGKNEEALPLFEQIIHLEPTYAENYYNKGWVLQQLGRYEEALLAHEQALQVNPIHVKSLFQKGLVLQQLGRYEEALRIWERIFQLDPTSNYVIAAYQSKGYSLLALGRLEEALGACEQVIRLDPTSGGGYRNKGGILGRLGRHQEALAAFEQAIRLNPTDSSAHVNKGAMLHQLGRLQEAEQAYQKARELRERG